MPQDPNLYGQRPPKKQKREMTISSTLDFASQLTSLMAKPADLSSSKSSATAIPSSSAGRSRPSRSKDDSFSGVKVKRKNGSSAEPAADPRRLRLKSPVGTEDDRAEQARARRKMEAKARLYAAMKRGDYVPKEGETAPLVDFDRKWAERHRGEGGGDDDGGLVSSSSDSSGAEEEDYRDTEQVEYTDEFGRQRRGTRAEVLRLERQQRRGETSAAELDRMSARPRAPEGVIVGDAVQAEAFRPLDPEAMAAGALKRDRSLTPPPAAHYEADREIRTRGTGFYAFSKDEATRAQEMRGLEEERARTEAARREREEKVEARRREIEARRKEIGERKAKKLADSFLDGLEKQLLGDDSGR